MSSDIVVIGAGIHGCATALRLAQAGAQVTVLERSVPGAEASSAAGGILSPGVEASRDVIDAGDAPVLDGDAPHLPGEETDSGGRRGGDKRAQEWFRIEARLVAEEEAATRPGGERRLEGAERRAVEPLGSDTEADEPGQISAPDRRLGFAEDDAQGAVRAIGEVDAGGSLELGGEARPAPHRFLGEREERSAVLRLDAGREDPAGAWAGLVEGSGLPAGAVRPVRGQMVVLEARPELVSRVVFSPRGYLVPRPDGRILCGSTMEEAGFTRVVTASGMLGILGMAIETAPELAAAPVVESWSNFRPATADGLPILGAGAVPGLFYSTGHHRHGILLAPASADLVAASLLGEAPALDLSPYSAARLG